MNKPLTNKEKIMEEKFNGLKELLGETVTLFCVTYFYHGKLVAVGEDEVKLENPSIIYETGNWKDKEWSDIQDMHLPDGLIVRKSAIESYGKTK